jgi:hypothetical protein
MRSAAERKTAFWCSIPGRELQRGRDERLPHRLTSQRSELMKVVILAGGSAGLLSIDRYRKSPDLVRNVRRNLFRFPLDAEESGQVVVGYGAPAKAVTPLSYCDVGADLLQFTIGRSPHKHGRVLPGSRLPIYEPDRIRTAKPHFILIFLWNIKDEIIGQLSYVRSWGAKFVVPIQQMAVTP